VSLNLKLRLERGLHEFKKVLFNIHLRLIFESYSSEVKHVVEAKIRPMFFDFLGNWLIVLRVLDDLCIIEPYSIGVYVVLLKKF
jgi:hypothetical protein